ncbi:CBS domain-containing protein [Suttonella sp. R2A3]|uniref:HlyC/CorC family transporter n=1 Tax=Suttonella sp. R2A3 TaxID=2908648 RepID=UPI001F362956|nr:transporter associated domain-containing protein [Suttonella sp. R2A3]UJF23908.1 CBS domain-containing protein [Suttonella sp. R2A3]
MNDDSSEPKTGWLDRLTGLWGDSSDDEDPHAAIRHALRDALEANSLSAYNVSMMESLLDIHETQVRDIMVPRGQMTLLQEDWSMEKVLSVILESGHSRHPVVDEEHEKLLGILLSKDLLPQLTELDNESGFMHLLRPATIVPESKPLDAMLSEFRSNRNHMALVIDEYGNLSGLVTIEDVIEEIVGEIDDEHDEIEDAPIIALNDGTYQVQALTEIDEFNDAFHTTLSDEDADTIGGYVLLALGRMPHIGESIHAQGLIITVSKANQRRIISLNVRQDAS